MNAIFLTADTHLDHKNIIGYCDRPYDTITEMNEDLVKRWNNVVKKDDLVYHLGDFAWRNHAYWLDRLNGKKILIMGNHDNMNVASKNKFQSMHHLLSCKIEGQDVTLCHYPMCTWNKIWYDAWHFYGHVHGTKIEREDLHAFDVGVDSWNYQPVPWEVIKLKMADVKKYISTPEMEIQTDINRAQLFGANRYYLNKYYEKK